MFFEFLVQQQHRKRKLSVRIPYGVCEKLLGKIGEDKTEKIFQKSQKELAAELKRVEARIAELRVKGVKETNSEESDYYY